MRRRIIAWATAALLLLPAALPAGASNADACPVAGAHTFWSGPPQPWEVAPAEFGDVFYYQVHHHSIDCVVHWRIAQGSNGLFRPEADLSRGQTATFVANMVLRSGGSLPTPSHTYADVASGHAHGTAIGRLAAAGVGGGATPTRFEPNRSATRGEMAAFIVEAYEHRTGLALVSGSTRFGDITGHRHETAIRKAVTAGFTSGVSANRFEPDRPLSRGQMATFITRVLDQLVGDGLSAPPHRASGDPPGRVGGPTGPMPSADPSTYAFWHLNGDGSPVRFNPCEPLRVVANFTNAPAGASASLARALQQIERGTGIRVHYRGEVSWTEPDFATLVDGRWPPVLVHWPAEPPPWMADIPGVGGYATAGLVWRSGREYLVTGEVGVNPNVPAGDPLVAVLMHEIGHVVGLDHPDSGTAQVMGHYHSAPRVSWGSGDLAGLARVGRPAGCQWTPYPENVMYP